MVLPAKFRGGSASGGDSRFSLRLIRLWRKKSAGMARASLALVIPECLCRGSSKLRLTGGRYYTPLSVGSGAHLQAPTFATEGRSGTAGRLAH
ncbi:MAG: hypothetical protein A2Z83_03680 [Omnitrophica bacterium GWA2_52_8]|nr:MAG: hypothetical protein A2Z83_03680 [Omnitrophica bacterium GWA2_52_8]